MNRKREAIFMGFGILAGLALNGPAVQAADYLTATVSTQPIYVNGQRVQMEAYSIHGNNFVKLRDIGRAVDFGVAYDAATNSVHIDSSQPYREEPAATPLSPTEESVQAALAQLREIYPTGAVFPTPYRSTSGGPYGRGIHCSGWATLCSDAAFGNLPWRRVDNPSWDQIRPGDLIRYDNSSNGHVVVVVNKTDEYVKVTESGLNNKARWGGQYFKWWLEEQLCTHAIRNSTATANRRGPLHTAAPSRFPRVRPCKAVCAHSAERVASVSLTQVKRGVVPFVRRCAGGANYTTVNKE